MTTAAILWLPLFGDQKKVLGDERIVWLTALMGGAILAGAAIIALIGRWRKRQLEDTSIPLESFGSFRAMYERGELSREEYDRIKARLAAKAKSEILRGDAKAKAGDVLDLKNIADEPEPPPKTGDATNGT